MYSYAMMIHPGNSRAFRGEALALQLCEFEFAAARLSCGCFAIKIDMLAGIPSICFETQSPLSDADAGILARLSSAFALFEHR